MHRVHTHSFAVVVFVSFCLVGAGCTTTRTLPVPRTAAETRTNTVEPGNKVIVTLRSGEVRTFRVTTVESDALVGKDVRIPFADIEKLQRKKINGGRTAGLILGVVVVAAGAFAAILINAYENDD